MQPYRTENHVVPHNKYAAAQFVEVLRYKPKGLGFDSQ